jgi:hypothetical protein
LPLATNLASALLTMVFAAAMLVVGHWYIEKGRRKLRLSPPLKHSCPG